MFTFNGEWDEEGVSFYQAFNDKIADWAVENQRFGGPHFNPTRMTWIKPSFAWVLYRAGCTPLPAPPHTAPGGVPCLTGACGERWQCC